MDYRLKEKILNYNEVIENPGLLVPSYSYTIAHQKLGFVTQRRVVDKWGRMMLLKPNRKYFKGESKVYFDYHVHDYLDKMLALSLLKDDDYDDLVIPQNQYKDLLIEKTMGAVRNRSASPSRLPTVDVLGSAEADAVDIRVEIRAEDLLS